MITAQMIRDAIRTKPDGFYMDHEFRTALADGFPMYHDAPVVGKWLESIGFEVVKTWDGPTAGYAQTVEGICVYRGGLVRVERWSRTK